MIPAPPTGKNELIAACERELVHVSPDWLASLWSTLVISLDMLMFGLLRQNRCRGQPKNNIKLFKLICSTFQARLLQSRVNIRYYYVNSGSKVSKWMETCPIWNNGNAELGRHKETKSCTAIMIVTCCVHSIIMVSHLNVTCRLLNFCFVWLTLTFLRVVTVILHILSSKCCFLMKQLYVVKFVRCSGRIKHFYNWLYIFTSHFQW